MKKIVLILSVLCLAAAALFALPTGKSMMYSDSYMLRARGTEALYWNPALLNSSYQDIWLPVVNGGFQIVNNSLDLQTYNDLVGTEYLNDDDKEKFLNKIDQRLTFTTEGHYSVFGFTNGSVAYASALHLYGNMSLSKKYLSLMLYGNTEEEYIFYKANNNLAGITFTDFTMGVGDIKINLNEDVIPPIIFGLSGSLLIGGAEIHTKDYTGSLTSNIDGLSAVQNFTLGTGFGGFGYKAMLGLASDPLPNLSVGLTLDNIFGALNWSLLNEDNHFKFQIDSLYAANLSDDFFTESKTTSDAGSFSTRIPPELRMATMYHLDSFSLSLDYVQGFDNSVMTTKKGRIAAGMELLALPRFPIHLGVGFGNSDYPWRVSYGFGLKTRAVEMGIGFQCFESVLPSYSTKGVSLSSYFNVRL